MENRLFLGENRIVKVGNRWKMQCEWNKNAMGCSTNLYHHSKWKFDVKMCNGWWERGVNVWKMGEVTMDLRGWNTQNGKGVDPSKGNSRNNTFDLPLKQIMTRIRLYGIAMWLYDSKQVILWGTCKMRWIHVKHGGYCEYNRIKHVGQLEIHRM
jgi:hypothetical protein